MALIKRILNTDTPFLLRGIHTSIVRNLDQKWRQGKGLPQNPNVFGPLTNLPDYSFKDGRPTPYGCRQRKRLNKQAEYLARIKKLVGEVDYAVRKHEESTMAAKEEKQRILDSKLKPKGQVLLKAGESP